MAHVSEVCTYHTHAWCTQSDVCGGGGGGDGGGGGGDGDGGDGDGGGGGGGER